ncbi:putative motility protein [Craterilacuibacter sinensis]|uniref:Putative motility protein n=1 Tax=Craterilacuibacter sinensis TaxID=2686017 RepID=A0A845BQZ0_9NEIS|nr:putative motility protein [Craterilacuibacter sinensis]MXR37820.1 putative motility protein [Craterilacuibacter sinensis]
MEAISQMQQAQVQQSVQITMLKKATQIEAQGALALLQSVPVPAQLNNPAHLGQSVDTKA